MTTVVNNLVDLNNLVKEDAKNNVDHVVCVKDIMWHNGKLFVAGLGEFEPTKLCLDQLCSKADVMPTTAEWLKDNYRKEFEVIMHDLVKKWVANTHESKEVLVRLRNVGGEMKARALLSTRYGIMDNHSAVQVLKDSLPPEFQQLQFNGIKNGAIINPETGKMTCKVLVPSSLPGTDNDPHSFGFIISNDETGKGSLEVSASYLRAFCTNQLRGIGNIAKYRHIGTDRFARIEDDFKSLIEKTESTASDKFKAYWNTRDKKVECAEEFLLREGNMLRLPKKALKDIIKEGRLLRNVQETGSTVYSVIQSLTEYARDLEDAAAAELFEIAAGNLVNCRG